MDSASQNHHSCLYPLSKEICSADDIFMCPLGDNSRRYQRLSEMCTFAKVRCYRSLSWAYARVGTVYLSRRGEDKALGCPEEAGSPFPTRRHSRKLSVKLFCSSPQLTHLFDNEGTVIFAIFMALWGELLLGIPRGL